MSIADFDIEKLVFEPIEEAVKKDLWCECRDLISDCFLKDFKSNVEFGQKLYEVSKPASPKRIKSSTMAHYFVKIGKLKQMLDDPIRAITKLANLLITFRGEMLLDLDMYTEFFGLLKDFVGRLYLCPSETCNDQCKCHVTFCNYAIKCSFIDDKELCSSKSPGRMLFEKLCATMIKSVNTLLQEMDSFIPTYKCIEKFNCSGLRKLLVEHKMSFQVTYQNAILWIHVANDHDRCGAKEFLQIYLPSSVKQ